MLKNSMLLNKMLRINGPKIFLWNFKILLKFIIMIENIQAVYKNGVLRPLQPLDLPEDEIVNIDIRDSSEISNEELVNVEKVKAFEEWMSRLDPNTPNLTNEQISRGRMYEEQTQRQL